MEEIFLSASVPVIGRGQYFETADPFLIQVAVREFVTAVLGRRIIVWGGHPAITPMVWSVCEDLGVNYAHAVILYQSRYFDEQFPDENRHFANVVYTDAVLDDRARSLELMRQAMLSRSAIAAAVFIGGMEGILDEYKMLTQFHPKVKVLAVPAPGGAARQLAEQIGRGDHARRNDDVDFVRLFHRELNIRPDEARRFRPSS